MDKKHANASSNNSLANTPHAHHRTPVLPGVRHVHPGRECDPGILWEQQRKCVRSGRRRCTAVLLLLVQRRHHPKFERYTGRHLHPLSHRRRGHTGERPSGRAQYRGPVAIYLCVEHGGHHDDDHRMVLALDHPAHHQAHSVRSDLHRDAYEAARCSECIHAARRNEVPAWLCAPTLTGQQAGKPTSMNWTQASNRSLFPQLPRAKQPGDQGTSIQQHHPR